jgi:transcriptional regulator GlxA family with amidase domain
MSNWGIAMTHNVGIYIFNNVEVLDFAGPYEVFTAASRVQAKGNPGCAPLFNVFTIASEQSRIKARAGLNVFPDYTFVSHPKIDVLIILGGVVTTELEKPTVIDWITKQDRQTAIVASVCTGAFLLAKAGLLNGKQATTHWEDIDDLQKMFPSVHVTENCRWVDEGKYVTSAGISAGIDMCLHLVERLSNRDLALRTARQIDFDWAENHQSS